MARLSAAELKRPFGLTGWLFHIMIEAEQIRVDAKHTAKLTHSTEERRRER